MTWTTPATPVGGTPITVSFYSTNIGENLSHLRAILPDPGGSGRLLVSTGSATAGFSTDGVIATNIDQRGGALTHQIQRTSGDANQIGFLLARQAGALWQWRLPANSNDCDIEQYGLGTFIKLVMNGGVSVERDANFTAGLTKGGTAVSVEGHEHMVTGDYVGNGGTTGRQIACGFVPKFVYLWDQTTGSSAYLIVHDSGSLRLHASGNPSFSTGVKMHTTDGFTVGNGNTNGNDNAETYRWVATR